MALAARTMAHSVKGTGTVSAEVKRPATNPVRNFRAAQKSRTVTVNFSFHPAIPFRAMDIAHESVVPYRCRPKHTSPASPPSA
jgi:hypothetical protein